MIIEKQEINIKIMEDTFAYFDQEVEKTINKEVDGLCNHDQGEDEDGFCIICGEFDIKISDHKDWGYSTRVHNHTTKKKNSIERALKNPSVFEPNFSLKQRCLEDTNDFLQQLVGKGLKGKNLRTVAAALIRILFWNENKVKIPIWILLSGFKIKSIDLVHGFSIVAFEFPNLKIPQNLLETKPEDVLDYEGYSSLIEEFPSKLFEQIDSPSQTIAFAWILLKTGVNLGKASVKKTSKEMKKLLDV